WAVEAKRDPNAIRLSCCLPIEVTSQPVSQEEDRLMGTPEQLLAALRRFQEIGVEHLALQFMVPRWPERIEQIEGIAREAMPKPRPSITIRVSTAATSAYSLKLDHPSLPPHPPVPI